MTFCTEVSTCPVFLEPEIQKKKLQTCCVLTAFGFL